MAKETLDPTPSSEKASSRVSESIRRLPKAAPKKDSSRAGWNEYIELLNDRPEKLRPEEVGYREATGTERCAICSHFFRQSGGRQRTVCEIMRDGDADIDPLKVCDFFNVDGEKYPLLKISQTKETSGHEGGKDVKTKEE